MTRKKKLPSQPRCHQFTDSSGWTHIIKGLKNTHTSSSLLKQNKDKLQPAPIPPGQTLLDLQKTHALYRSQWLSSPCYQHIRSLFVDDVLPQMRGRGKIDRCVALGLGSLSNGRRSAWWEFVFLETVLELLLSSSASPPSTAQSVLKVFLQDPIFNALDHTFLSSLSDNYTTLPHPLAFAEITDTTFLFAPHLELEVYAKALSQAMQPNLCVGTDLRECVDRWAVRRHGEDKDMGGGEGEDENKDNGVFERYLERTVERKLPEFERDDWMYFTCVYRARSDKEDDTS
ncbi:MAG: hypothetical protein Q9201_007797 [Fulgogasparrea decipioides]